MKLHTKSWTSALAVAAVVALGACDMSSFDSIEIADGIKDAAAGQTVNGSIRVGNDVTVTSGAFRTVNGAASVGSRSVVPAISVVNGAIRIGEESRTGSLSAVNGAISVGERVTVAGHVETVNGVVILSTGSRVEGDVKAVNGRLALDGAHVTGELGNHNGGILLAGATVIEGDLVVSKPDSRNFGISFDELPEVNIGPGVEVRGRLVFEREVNLTIHRGAKLGEIVGATPTWIESEG